MIPEAEARVQRKITSAFIATDAATVNLVPIRRQDNGAGGWTRSFGTPRVPQVMRMIPTNFEGEQETLDGKRVSPTHVLMGEYNAEMERGDRFLFKGSMYEVTYVQEKQDYQVKGWAHYIGPATPADIETGAAVAAYVLTQAVPSTVWTFSNPTGRLADVNVYVGGETVMADVQCTISTITVTFSEAVAGQIVVS